MYILKKMGRMPFQNFMQDNILFVIKYEPFGVKSYFIEASQRKLPSCQIWQQWRYKNLSLSRVFARPRELTLWVGANEGKSKSFSVWWGKTF